MTTPLEVYRLQFRRPAYARNRIAPDHDYVLARLPESGTLLDVGSGAGSFVSKVRARFPGIQVSTCDLEKFHSHDLPFFSVDLTNPEALKALAARSEPLLSCVGVLEHLPENRVPEAVEALAKACTKDALITTANHTDIGAGGHELHLTQQPLDWWVDQLGVHFLVVEASEYSSGRGLCFTCEVPSWQGRVINFWENVHRRGSNVHMGNTQARDYTTYFSQAGPFAEDLAKAQGVLDVGPGFGRFLNSVNGTQRYAIDVSAASRERVQAMGVAAFAPGGISADVVGLATCLSVIQHCESPAVEAIFADVSRALRKGGRFYLNGIHGGHHTPGPEALLSAGRCSHSLEIMRLVAESYGFSVVGEDFSRAGALGIWILCLESQK